METSYKANTLYIGPGEARDVLFDAPAYDGLRPSGPTGGDPTDSLGDYNVYYFRNRDWRKLANPSKPGVTNVPQGGMMTEVRVYQNPIPSQTLVNQTYDHV